MKSKDFLYGWNWPMGIICTKTWAPFCEGYKKYLSPSWFAKRLIINPSEKCTFQLAAIETLTLTPFDRGVLFLGGNHHTAANHILQSIHQGRKFLVDLAWIMKPVGLIIFLLMGCSIIFGLNFKKVRLSHSNLFPKSESPDNHFLPTHVCTWSLWSLFPCAPLEMVQ